ncbi:hypothetical protein ACO0LF_05880 [Undibacterium sp. Di27W]|uniref:hypothetical protein n=1 Tax=Undibacterium sp. Di27W TaxID=3413036 RepID=UPI003BF26DDE
MSSFSHILFAHECNNPWPASLMAIAWTCGWCFLGFYSLHRTSGLPVRLFSLVTRYLLSDALFSFRTTALKKR